MSISKACFHYIKSVLNETYIDYIESYRIISNRTSIFAYLRIIAQCITFDHDSWFSEKQTETVNWKPEGSSLHFLEENVVVLLLGAS